MAELKKYADIPELNDIAAILHNKNEYTYIINAEKYQQTGELEVKRVLKKDLLPEASTSYVFFKREGCHGYPLNDQDLTIKSSLGYVGPFQMNSRACTDFLNHVKEKHPEIKDYISGSGTNGYLRFVKKYPDKEKLKEIIEEYALRGYYKDRPGKPDTLAANLASHLKRTDEKGTPDATRLPLHVIAALPTGIIARGNGKNFNALIPKITEKNIDDKCISWIKSNLGEKAYNKLKEVDYLTPEILDQYQTMNLPGIENLQQKYNELVNKKEDQMQQEAFHNYKAQIFEPDALRVAIPQEINVKIPLNDRQKKFITRLNAKKAKEQLKAKEVTPKAPEKGKPLASAATNGNSISYLRANHGRE